jgi:hypothetical protein
MAVMTPAAVSKPHRSTKASMSQGEKQKQMCFCCGCIFDIKRNHEYLPPVFLTDNYSTTFGEMKRRSCYDVVTANDDDDFGSDLMVVDPWLTTGDAARDAFNAQERVHTKVLHRQIATCSIGMSAIQNAIFNCGFEVDTMDEEGRSALHYCVADGCIYPLDTRSTPPGAEDMISRKRVGREARRELRFTMEDLHVTAQTSHADLQTRHDAEEVVVALLASGANPNLKDARGLTPTWLAGMYGSCAVFALLVEGGGDVTTLDSSGMPLLIAMIRFGVGRDIGQRVEVVLTSGLYDVEDRFRGLTVYEWANHSCKEDLAHRIQIFQDKRT